MTVTGSSSLLNLFQSKIEDAVELVSLMGADEKLKSVQYWNAISGKLQDIVNNTADINALSLKLDDVNKKLPYPQGNEPGDNISPNGIYSSEYININISSNYVETNSHSSSSNLANIQNGFFPQSNTPSFTSLGLPESNISSTNCVPDSSEGDYQSALNLDVIENVFRQASAVSDLSPKKKTGKNSKNIIQAELHNSDSGSYLLELLTNVPTNSDQQNSHDTIESIVAADDSNLQPVPFDTSDNSSNLKIDQTSNPTDNQLLICDWCEQEFSDNASLDSHRLLHTKPFFCTECNAQFSCKGSLKVHMRSHTGEKPYVCSTCSAKFSTRGNLKRHVRSHSGIRPHRCPHCGSCFTEKKSLVVHIRRHTGEKPFECNVCGQKFSQSGILQSHMAVHKDERSHLCEHCGKAFRQKSQLRVHKMRHNGVRKYSCKQCSSSFLIKGDLERHKRTHTGERPFVCDICRKSFTRLQSLKEHTNRHLGLKPFKCKYCGKTFAEMSACYKHTKHHEKQSQKTSTGKSVLLEPSSTKEVVECDEVKISTEYWKTVKLA